MISQKNLSERHGPDRLFYWGVKAVAWSVILLFLIMLLIVFRQAWPAFEHFGLSFFWSDSWNVPTDEYGALVFIYGTALSSFLAILFALPVSLGVSLFLSELAPRGLAVVVGFVVEMLAAIPSIVYGLWGFFFLAPILREFVQPILQNYLGFLPIFQGPPLGVGVFSAGVILAIMIMPTMTAICREVFRAIPVSLREAALGLGATRWEMIQISVLRTALPGIIGAVILGLGRAMGETMAVTMVIGNSPRIAASWFAPGQSMASLMANQYAEAETDLHLAALTAVGFSLFLLSLIVNASARGLIAWVNRRGGTL